MKAISCSENKMRFLNAWYSLWRRDTKIICFQQFVGNTRTRLQFYKTDRANAERLVNDL